MGMRNLYLNTVSVEEAWQLYQQSLDCQGLRSAEEISVQDSLGRITARAVYAKCCSPLYNSAAMDGIAVIASHTEGATERTPKTLYPGTDYQIVDTGDPVKLPYDAVIMAEDLLEPERGEQGTEQESGRDLKQVTGQGTKMDLEQDAVKIISSVPAWNHIRPIGEDIVVGEMILSGQHKIRPVDIGALLAGGINNITVFRQPTVGIIPTGTEIIEPGQKPEEGDIIDSNSRMFCAMVREYGGIPKRYPIVADDYGKIRRAVMDAVKDHDIVLVSAGSSAGTQDYTVHILRELGEVVVHGVAMKPGKPVILAIVQGKPVIGLPGYPVSAYLAFENFVRPIIGLASGEQYGTGNQIEAVVSKRLVSSLKHREYIRVKVGKVGGNYVAAPLARGAGAAMSLVRADGFCVIEKNSEGYEAGERVTVELYKDLQEIEHTAVAIGSHDLILDVLSDLMPLKYPGHFLSSTHIGSMGGLMALKRGEAHLAPTHLLDEETGIYNIAYLKRLFPNKKMALIKGVKRIQGILVKKGNPLGIRGIEDLTRCRYVNRQRGAGTRVLLDYKLKLLGIDQADVKGYDTEAATHMAVAARVKEGGADAGMGILSAARAMGLDFIEVGEEEYDFALEWENLELPEIQMFIEILASPEFREKVSALGGYGLDKTGTIVDIW